MQVLTTRNLKLCTVDSVISLRRRYEASTQRLLTALVETDLGEHWLQHCEGNRAASYVELMARWNTSDSECVSSSL